MAKQHYDKDAIKAAAQGQWHFILPRLGIPESSLCNKHQPCPMCGGKDRFRFDNKQGQGTYYCNQCGAGDGFGFVMAWQQCSFSEALESVARVLGLIKGDVMPNHRQPANITHHASKDELEALQHIWNSAIAINDTPAAQYLQARGLSEATIARIDSNALRYGDYLTYWTYSEVQKHWIAVGHYPAMIGAIVSRDGDLLGLHITYLQATETGYSKARITHPETGTTLPNKKIRSRFDGSTRGASVHLLEPSSDDATLLVLAEGIETTIAACELFDDTGGAWACLSANGLSCVNVDLHRYQNVLIAADNDVPRPVGFEAACTLATRIQQAGLSVKLYQPFTQGYDALDELNRIKRQQS